MAKLKLQVSALMRKSIAYQRRNCCMNVFLCLAPVIFCIILKLMQVAIDGALGGEDNSCGCKCISCGFTNNNTRLEGDACPVAGRNYKKEQDSDPEPSLKCYKRDSSVCGFQYSVGSQIPWCPIEFPSRFPPLYPTQQAEIAIIGPNKADFLYTGTNRNFADKVASTIVNTPDPERFADPVVQKALQSAADGLKTATFDFSFLSLAGLDMGTDDSDVVTLFSDPAFASNELQIYSKDCYANQALLQEFSQNSSATLLTNFLASTGCALSTSSFLDTADSIEKQLYCSFKKAKCPEVRSYTQAYDYLDSGPARLNAVIYHNDSSKIATDGGDRGGPSKLQRVNKAIDATINGFIKTWIGPKYRAQLVAQTEMPKVGSKLTLDFSSLLGPLFFLWLIQLPLPITLVQLVYEKEKRLRLMMRMHGLTNSVYMSITYLYFIIIYCIYIIIMLIFGAAIGLKFFRLNNAGVQIIFYFFYGNVQVAFCYLLSCFFRSSRAAIVTGFLWVFASGLICFFLIDAFFINERWFTFLIQLVPSFGAYRGLWELAQYSFKAAYQNETAMSFSDLGSDGNGMGIMWLIFVLEWPTFMLLAWYLEQVLESGTGIRKHWLFPLHASCLRSCAVKPDDKPFAIDVADLNHSDLTLPEDVARERAKAASVAPGPDHPIVVHDLRKEFAAQDGNPKKLAVQNMSLCVPKGECFGLLGPNGAGKSTSINMMIGFLEPSAGEAHISGFNLRTQMDEIYKIMGVCPQHDLLWEKLTSREHLNFYGRLKGLTGPELKENVDAALKSVNLFDVANKPCGQYSGGMKRRLSVAISLIGSPRVVYLDEPSTGLDPASRRNLWDVVMDAKTDKAIILTTHSMEEAEVLCDRLGIFVDGKLVCIGNPKELSSRYGGYYMFTISVNEGDEPAAEALVRRMSANATQMYSLGGTVKYQIPMADIQLSQIFKHVSDASGGGLKIIDWGVHNASLEDVFIHLASQSIMYTKVYSGLGPGGGSETPSTNTPPSL